VTQAAGGSLNVQYLFHGTRLRPYLTAGVGALWSRSVWSRTRVRGSQAIQSERNVEDLGFGPDVGAGLRVPLTAKTSVAADIRWLEAGTTSPLNLSVARASIRLVHGW
jgi:opacity protein-like surface antigen